MQCITPGCPNPAQLTPQGSDPDGWDDPATVVPICPPHDTWTLR